MESALIAFFSAQTIIFCAGIWMAVLITRRILEYKFPNIQKSRWWNELFLPLGPVGTGMVVALFVPQLLPVAFAVVWKTKIFFGGVCGGISGYGYKIVKGLLKKEAKALAVDGDDDKDDLIK